MDFDACISRLTGKDARKAYAFAQQITEESRASDAWYPCFDRFAELLRHKNSLVRIRAALEQADLNGYPDSMQPLILKDIVAALQKIEE